MSKRKLIPHIRFKEFEEEWKTKKLEEITEIAMGQSPSSKNYLKSEIKDSYVLIQGNADIKNNKIVPRVWTTQATKLSNPGDIILTVRAPVGELARNKFQAVIGRGVSAFKGNDFLFYYLQKLNIEGYWQHLSAGSTFESVSSKDIASTATELTSIAEQQKIGNLLAKLDRLLDLQQQKLDQLELLKKALLQKLFPKQDAKIPELRFKGFVEEWGDFVLGKIAKFLNGRAYKQSELLEKGKYPVLRVGNFYTNDSWYYSNLQLPEKYYAKKGDLLYTWSATFGPHIWNGSTVIYHYHIWKIELSSLLNKEFTYQLLLEDRSKLLNNTNGSTMFHLTKSEMESKLVKIPNIAEQQKVGNLLAKVDRLIELENKKFGNLKLVKKSLLQNMFVE